MNGTAIATFKQTALGRDKRKVFVALGLGGVILLGAFLRFYKLGAYSVGNAYYAATVQSMLTSWRNFFFGAFEPGGSVTVDKPPLGFWVQAASAAVLGVNGFALALPQALAGVLSIPLLYRLVKHPFGAEAGLIAALALAVTPVAVSTERNNTIDGLLVFVLLLATWAFLRATRSGRLRDVLLGAFLVGVGFNIKMLQALIPLPALYALYLLGAPYRWCKRVAYLSAATVVLIVVSLSWAVIVDLTPADARPYVGSSTENSVLELILGHNGLRRLTALGGGLQPASLSQPPDDGPTGQNVYPAQGAPSDRGARPLPPSNGASVPPKPGGDASQTAPPGPPPGVRTGDGSGGPPLPSQSPPQGRNQETGTPGLSRLFTAPLVTEASWLLPLALLGLPLLLAQLGWQWPLSERHLAVLLWAGWLLPTVGYFTFTSGLFHAYYLIMLGPPLAALVGATAWALARVYRQRRDQGWALTALLVGVTLAFQVVTLLAYPGYLPWVAALSLVVLVGGLGTMALNRQRRKVLNQALIGITLLSLFVAPTLWSGLTAINPTPDVALPRAGPQTTTALRPSEIPAEQQALVDYLLAHTEPDSYLLATLSAMNAAPLILDTGRPVLTFGGFKGSDPVVDVAELAQRVADGELRFVLDQGLARQKPEIAAWLSDHCAPIQGPDTQTTNRRPAAQAARLYDCGDYCVEVGP